MRVQYSTTLRRGCCCRACHVMFCRFASLLPPQYCRPIRSRPKAKSLVLLIQLVLSMRRSAGPILYEIGPHSLASMLARQEKTGNNTPGCHANNFFYVHNLARTNFSVHSRLLSLRSRLPIVYSTRLVRSAELMIDACKARRGSNTRPGRMHELFSSLLLLGRPCLSASCRAMLCWRCTRATSPTCQDLYTYNHATQVDPFDTMSPHGEAGDYFQLNVVLGTV